MPLCVKILKLKGGLETVIGVWLITRANQATSVELQRRSAPVILRAQAQVRQTSRSMFGLQVAGSTSHRSSAVPRTDDFCSAAGGSRTTPIFLFGVKEYSTRCDTSIRVHCTTNGRCDIAELPGAEACIIIFASPSGWRAVSKASMASCMAHVRSLRCLYFRSDA